MKNIIRSGFCLTMEKEHKFTRDLGLCVQTFSHHYPEKSKEMQQALRYALDPTGNVVELMGFLSNFGGWIVWVAKLHEQSH